MRSKLTSRPRITMKQNVEVAAQRFPIDKNILKHNQVFIITNEGFKGVKPRQSNIKEYFLSGIVENDKESQIMSYLKDRNMSPTYISLFQSQRQGSVSAKINIPSLAAPLVEKKIFGQCMFGANHGGQNPRTMQHLFRRFGPEITGGSSIEDRR